MGDRPIDDVLELVRAQLIARRSDAAERVARIKSAADAYLDAIEQDIASQFAVRHGLEVPRPSTTVRAALDLRAAVDMLPESAIRPTPSTPPPRASAARQPSMVPGPLEAPLNPATEELVREMRAAGLDELPTDLFRVHAEEFAARARFLQESLAERPSDVEAISRVIRTLTAMVAKRGLSGIYGLSRGHTGDWQARADEAARRREHMLSIPPAASLPRTSTPAPALAIQADDAGDDADETPEASLALPSLRASSEDAPVVIVGGVTKNEKLARLRRRSDLKIEWIGVDPNSMLPIQSLERRVRDNRVAGLVVLQDLMGHKQVEPLIAAAQKSGVPWAYGDRAGSTALERALTDLDASIAQRRG